MITLNLTNVKISDIKFEKINFPDGQQNIILTSSRKHLNIGDIKDSSVQIKSRLNNWLDLELITCAVAVLRELEVEDIHLYIPYVVGARSDRKFSEGSSNYLKNVICPTINTLKCKTVMVLDPHSDCLEMGIKNFKKESNLELCWFAFKEIYGPGNIGPFTDSNFILVSPDAGASKKIFKIAEEIGFTGDIITCSKDRDVNGKLTKTVVPYDKTLGTTDKDLIIIDDICDGGATFINIAKTIKESEMFYGKIYLIVTHGIFSKGFEELKQYFDGIYCTNSYSDYNPYPKGIINKHLEMNPKAKFYDKPDNFVKQLNVF